MKSENGHTPWLRIIGVVVGLVLVAGACGSSKSASPTTTGGGGSTTSTTAAGPVRKPVKGGSLVFGTESDVATLAPGEAAQPSDKLITLGLYDPLMSYDKDGNITPFLATSMEASSTLDQYTMKVRADVTFHDGTPLNADAVVKHFNRLKDPATGCQCQTTIAAITSMETPDGPTGLTVVFHLSTPDVAFPHLLAGSSGYVESPTAVAGGLNLKTGESGTGPFTLAEFSPGDRVVLKAYPGYWGKDENGIQLPYLDSLTVKPIADAGQRVAALQTGDIDIFQTADSGTIKTSEDKGFAAQRVSGSSSTILLMNESKPPFNNVKARQAVAYATDKDLINKRAYSGVRNPSYSAFAPDSPYFDPKAGTPHYDPDKARALVKELGGLSFTITCIDTPEAATVLAIVKQLGEDVGMHITIEKQEQGVFVNRIFSKGGDYEAACFRSGQIVDPDAIRSGLTTGDAGNVVFYSNPTVDKLLDEARQTADFDTRKAKYFQVQEITGNEVPIITTLYDLFGNVYNAKRVGPPPQAEFNSLGALKPGLLYAVGG